MEATSTNDGVIIADGKNANSPLTLSAPQQAPAPPVQIALKGIANIFDDSLVVFKTIDATGESEKPYILARGQRRDGIEVVSINARLREVTFNNHGVIQKLSLFSATIDTNIAQNVDGAPDAPDHPEIPRPNGVGGGVPSYLGGDENGQISGERMTHEQQILAIEVQRAYYRSRSDPESQRLAQSLPPTSMTPPDAYDPSAATTATTQ